MTMYAQARDCVMLDWCRQSVLGGEGWLDASKRAVQRLMLSADLASSVCLVLSVPGGSGSARRAATCISLLMGSRNAWPCCLAMPAGT
jgi:hypothetical protein